MTCARSHNRGLTPDLSASVQDMFHWPLQFCSSLFSTLLHAPGVIRHHQWAPLSSDLCLGLAGEELDGWEMGREECETRHFFPSLLPHCGAAAGWQFLPGPFCPAPCVSGFPEQLPSVPPQTLKCYILLCGFSTSCPHRCKQKAH